MNQKLKNLFKIIIIFLWTYTLSQFMVSQPVLNYAHTFSGDGFILVEFTIFTFMIFSGLSLICVLFRNEIYKGLFK